MAYKENETTLSSDIPTVLFNAVENQRVSRNQTKKGVVAAALNLWVSLPKEIQDRLTDSETAATTIELVIRRIVEQTATGLKAVRKQPDRKTGEAG